MNISSDVATRKSWKMLSDASVFKFPNVIPISGTGIGDKILKFTRLDDNTITRELYRPCMIIGIKIAPVLKKINIIIRPEPAMDSNAEFVGSSPTFEMIKE